MAPFAFLLIVGCKSDVEKLLDAHGDKLKAQLDKIAALSPMVEKQPKLTADNWPVPGATWPENIYQKPDGNALWVWSHQLVDPCTHWDTTFEKDNVQGGHIIIEHSKLNTTGDLLKYPGCALTGNKEGAAGLDETPVKYIEGVKYVLVLRPTVKEAPSVVSSKREANKGDRLFVPGRIAGDALLYDLTTSKLVGGFMFDATNSESVKVTGYHELEIDVGQNLATQLAAKLSMGPAR